MDFTIRRTRDVRNSDIYYDSSAAFVYWSEADYSPNSAYTQTLETRIPDSQWESMRQSLRSTLSARRGVLGPQQDQNGQNTGYDYVVGDGIPKPDDEISELNLSPVKVNNKPFAKRRESGEIVVGPYRSAVKVRVLKRPGRVTDPGTYLGVNRFPAFLCGSSGFRVVGDRWYFSPRVFIQPNRSWPFYVSIEEAKTRWVMPGFYTAKGLYEYLSSDENLKPDAGLVTETWANNNRLRLDFLTAVAEAPKTISSFLDHLGSLGRMVVDFKKRKIFLTKGHQRVIERYGQSYKATRDSLISRYNDMIARARSPRKKGELTQVLRKKLRNLQKDHKHTLNKANREYATSIASLWLQWRYEIMPLYYTAQDALDVIADLHSDYLTSRKRATSEVVITTQPEWGLTVSEVVIPQLQKVMVKSKLDPTESYGKTMSTNPFSTAWELLTLSFVVDWFINIGDVIASFTGGYSDTSGATASCLYDFSNTIMSKDSPDAFVNFSIKFYTRQVIDPRLCGGLVISPDLNLQRNLDAMALIWGRSKFKIHHHS